jgi:hypothetical protein
MIWSCGRGVKAGSEAAKSVDRAFLEAVETMCAVTPSRGGGGAPPVCATGVGSQGRRGGVLRADTATGRSRQRLYDAVSQPHHAAMMRAKATVA